MTENTRHATFRQYVLAAATAVVAILIVIAVTFATQEHNDRVLVEDLDRTGVELQLLGRQISDIKDADLVSMNDYISAYAQVERLQSDYDQKLQKYSELYVLRGREIVIAESSTSSASTASTTRKPGRT